MVWPLVSLLCSSMLRYPMALQEVTSVGIMPRIIGKNGQIYKSKKKSINHYVFNSIVQHLICCISIF